jgi:hypothetical protein
MFIETEEWGKLYVHTEKYSALKERLPFAAIWMNLEDAMLIKISWPQKDKYCMMLLT